VRAAGKIVCDAFVYVRSEEDDASGKDDENYDEDDGQTDSACAKFIKTCASHRFTSRANRRRTRSCPSVPTAPPSSTCVVSSRSLTFPSASRPVSPPVARVDAAAASSESQSSSLCCDKACHSCLAGCVSPALRHATRGTVPCPFYYLRSIVRKQVRRLSLLLIAY
jgi:hypothetical protein